MWEWIQTMDWAILRGLRQATTCGFLNYWMPKITMLGNAGVLWLLTAAGLLISRKYRRYGVLLLAALAVGALIGNLCLKPLVARARPCWLEVTELLIAVPKDYSFPSGHTLASVIGAAVLTAANRRFAFWAVPAAVLIAFSRLYLDVHFPTDVLMAALLGLAVALAVLSVARRLWPEKCEPSGGALPDPEERRETETV